MSIIIPTQSLQQQTTCSFPTQFSVILPLEFGEQGAEFSLPLGFPISFSLTLVLGGKRDPPPNSILCFCSISILFPNNIWVCRCFFPISKLFRNSIWVKIRFFPISIQVSNNIWMSRCFFPISLLLSNYVWVLQCFC